MENLTIGFIKILMKQERPDTTYTRISHEFTYKQSIYTWMCKANR